MNYINVDLEEIAVKLYDYSKNMDFADHEENKEQEIKDLIEALYNIKAIAQNELNFDYWRTFYSCLINL